MSYCLQALYLHMIVELSVLNLCVPAFLSGTPVLDICGKPKMVHLALYKSDCDCKLQRKSNSRAEYDAFIVLFP